MHTLYIEIATKLGLAMILGMIIGLERIFAHKTAGMRTYALISMGSALFVVISDLVSSQYIGVTTFDPMRMAAQIVAGVGFFAAGIMIWKDNNSTLVGLTTAAGLWIAAGIGMAAGFGLYGLATIATIFVLFVFLVLWVIEKRLRVWFSKEEAKDN
jgi:putative Mg2+ transporter-C (MgtC) family protein